MFSEPKKKHDWNTMARYFFLFFACSLLFISKPFLAMQTKDDGEQIENRLKRLNRKLLDLQQQETALENTRKKVKAQYLKKLYDSELSLRNKELKRTLLRDKKKEKGYIEVLLKENCRGIETVFTDLVHELRKAQKEFFLACDVHNNLEGERNDCRKEYEGKKRRIIFQRGIKEKLCLRVLGGEDKIQDKLRVLNTLFIRIQKGYFESDMLDRNGEVYKIDCLPKSLCADISKECRRRFKTDHPHMKFMDSPYANYNCAIEVFGGHPILTSYRKYKIRRLEEHSEILSLPNLAP